MYKVKNNFVIVIAALSVLCIALAGYAAGLNSRLNTEKTKTLQLNDRIAGLNAKVNDLQAQLASAAVKANLAADLQVSLDAVNAELAKLKAAYADLESKLTTQIPLNQ